MSQSENVISIGVPDIDTLLGGGLRRGSTCLLEELHGESSGLTGIIGMDFLSSGIKRGEGGILLLSEHTVQEFQNLPGTHSILSIAKPNQFVFMDALSSMTYGEPMKSPTDTEEGIVRCTNVRYAPKFYEEWRTTVSRFEHPLMFIDSLSVLLHAMESDRVAWQFWLSLLPLIRHRQLTVVASFYPEMHSPSFVESVERICDTIVRFTSASKTNDEVTRFIEVIKNRGQTFDDRKHSYILKDFKFAIS
ncbi:MAG: RAD55 family ATPase [Candidatus Thorarchaeota archaeon]